MIILRGIGFREYLQDNALSAFNALNIQKMPWIAATVQGAGKSVRIPFTSECHRWIARRITQLLSVTAVLPTTGRPSNEAFTVRGVDSLKFLMFCIRAFKV